MSANKARYLESSCREYLLQVGTFHWLEFSCLNLHDKLKAIVTHNFTWFFQVEASPSRCEQLSPIVMFPFLQIFRGIANLCAQILVKPNLRDSILRVHPMGLDTGFLNRVN